MSELHTLYTALTPAQVAEQSSTLSGWKIESDPSSTTLNRTYTFKSFQQAIHFMHGLAEAIDHLNHHPDWQNVYNRVTVRITTHDRNNQLTLMDFRLAHLLDQHFDKQSSAIL